MVERYHPEHSPLWRVRPEFSSTHSALRVAIFRGLPGLHRGPLHRNVWLSLNDLSAHLAAGWYCATRRSLSASERTSVGFAVRWAGLVEAGGVPDGQCGHVWGPDPHGHRLATHPSGAGRPG